MHPSYTRSIAGSNPAGSTSKISKGKSTMVSNQKKTELLGEPFGTATSKLRKKLLFTLAGYLGLLDCYRCGNPIETLDTFSIEHKNSWASSENPKESFYDIDNISFSHLICNTRARNTNKLYETLEEKVKERYRVLKSNPEKYAKALENKRNWYKKKSQH